LEAKKVIIILKHDAIEYIEIWPVVGGLLEDITIILKHGAVENI
jgi:hypothetical protein